MVHTDPNSSRIVKNNFSNSHSQAVPLINVLIRTSGRPNYFNNSINSVLNQTYKNYNIIVGVDNKKTKEYAVKYNCSVISYDFSNVKIEKKIGIVSFPYNLYLNELHKYVENGYILYIDDDDMFNDNNALLKISEKIKNGYNLIMYRSQFPNDRIVPSDRNFYKYPVRDDMSTLCFCFNSIIKPEWQPYKGGDYKVAEFLYGKFKENISHINEALTIVQRNVEGGFGKRDDI